MKLKEMTPVSDPIEELEVENGRKPIGGDSIPDYADKSGKKWMLKKNETKEELIDRVKDEH